jgi:hypothetical protein
MGEDFFQSDRFQAVEGSVVSCDSYQLVIVHGKTPINVIDCTLNRVIGQYLIPKCSAMVWLLP